MKVFRIRKTRDGINPAPGVGRQLLEGLGLDQMADSVTTQTPSKNFAEGETVLNYGRSSQPKWMDKVIWINHPTRILNATDKIRCLDILENARVSKLVHTTNQEEAQRWADDGDKVVVRHTAIGKRGKGIEIINEGGAVPEAPLYTKFYDKTTEFRVHVVGGKVIDYVQKKRIGKKKQEERGIVPDDNVRNHGKGWVFCHKDIDVYPEVKDMSLRAVEALGLDFGGVDVLAIAGVDGRYVDAVVCEVNSAPGMSSPITLKAYLKAFEEMR